LMHAARDVGFQSLESWRRKDILQRVRRHVAQGESIVKGAAEAEELRRVGAEVPVAIHVQDAKGAILLRSPERATAPRVQQGGCRGFKLANLQRRIRQQG